MKVAVFSSKPYDRLFPKKVNQKYSHELYFITPDLDLVTAALAKKFTAICVFVNDILDRPVLEILAS